MKDREKQSAVAMESVSDGRMVKEFFFGGEKENVSE